ncbi:unnamed protein product [Adineta ricciae]|uniref:Calpain catalytic domain-containing protein n=1 Tax=Adineta ricciae TaxID=249248 RepID=A0A813TP00_ADIRI|nr:unnamed protein product [Adineta ricciae]
MMMSMAYSDTKQWACKICTFSNYISAYPECHVCRRIDPLLIENIYLEIPVRDSKTVTSLAVGNRQNQDEIDARKTFNDIISYCHQAKTNFVDDQFLPSSRSIGYKTENDLRWLRISQTRSLSLREDEHLTWTVYSSPSPADIQQGILGNCWLMAALSLIAEQSHIIEQIVLTKMINEEGAYLIRICYNGVWKIILVDDYFPCTVHNQLAYSQASRHQIYIPLIEKACAKLFGSYAELCSGTLEEGLQLLTGAPCDCININQDNDEFQSHTIWAKLLSACELRLLIGASTGCTGVTKEKYREVNINPNHAFSILAVCALPNISMQFVLVRDPHGATNYCEMLITPLILAQLNSSIQFSPPSGAFWISWSVFLQYFASITISSYRSDYYDVRQVAQFTRSSKESIPTFQFYVPKKSSVTISLLYHRQSRRLSCSHTQCFLLCDIHDRQMRTLGTHVSILQTDRRSFTQWTGSLDSGYYILIPFSTTFWNDENCGLQRSYTVVVHSNVQFDLQLVTEPATVLTDCFISAISKRGSSIAQDRCFHYYVIRGASDFFVFIAENLSTTDYLNIELDLSDSACIQSSRQAFITHDCIPPQHRQIIFFTEWTDTHNETPRFQYTFDYSYARLASQSIPVIDIHQHDFHSYRSI